MPTIGTDTKFAIVDLETTGSSPVRDRIIEVGIVFVENDRVIDELELLIDPEQKITPQITKITGITNEDVDGQPTFGEVALSLKEKLEDYVFVAHNARFDHGFLKNEFNREGISWHPQALCTVKLSRALYRQHKRHSLDSLIKRFGLYAGRRHRALDDCRAVWQFWRRALSEQGSEKFYQAMDKQLKVSSLPPYIDKKQIDALPEAPGVYLFYGDTEIPLYIGKSVRIKDRVLSHFYSSHTSRKEAQINKQIKQIDYQQTAGELGALLKEKQLIKEMQPLYNRKLRRNKDVVVLQLQQNETGYFEVVITPTQELTVAELQTTTGLFRTKKMAIEKLRELAKEYGLCGLYCGFEKGSGPCFSYQLGECAGACAGKVKPQQYNNLLTDVLSSYKMASWSFAGPIAIREYDRDAEITDIHVVDNWCHVATVRNEQELYEVFDNNDQLNFDFDSYKILHRFISDPKNRSQLIKIPANAATASNW